MTIPLTGVGGLGTRLGHVFGRMKDLLALRGDAVAGPQVGVGAGYPTLFKTLVTDLTGGTALPKTLGKFAPAAALSSWDSQQASLFTSLQSEAQAVMTAMYNLDLGNPEDFGAYPTCPPAVLQYLVVQMTGATLNTPTSTVQGATVSIGAQTNVGSPAGTPVIITSSKDTRGRTLQLMFPETIYFTCAQDAQGGATLGAEKLSFAGAAAAGAFGYQYPAGSGATGSLTLVNGELNNSGGNVLQNSGFNVFTNSNVADNWTISVGVAGTTVLDGGSANIYTTGNTHVLEFAGDGATLAAVTQAFNTTPASGVGAGGTAYKLLPNTQYALSMWVKVAGGAPAAGVLELALIDGSGNVLNDDFGTANSKTFDLTAGGLNIGVLYTNVTAVFRTPNNLLTQTTPFKLRLRQSTALTNAKNAFIARLSMSVMAPLYPGGPFVQAASSNVAPVNGLAPDQWTIAVANNYVLSGSGQFHMMFDRVFGLRAAGLQLPYAAAAPTVADSLIV